MSFGHALVGDVGRFDVTKLFLEDGLLWMHAVTWDVPKFKGGPCMVRFYSPDGALVAIVDALPIPGWDLGKHPGSATVAFSFSIVSRNPGDPYMGVMEGD